MDSNGWYIQLARARSGKPLWLIFDPPGKGNVTVAQSYVAAVCDTEAAGARWVISLDANLRSGLAEGNSTAKADSETDRQRPQPSSKSTRSGRLTTRSGVVGVISDYTGDNFEMSGEILNLISRRNLQFRAIWKAFAMEQPFSGLNTLVYADTAAPAADLRRKMMQFVEQGGLLVTGPKWGTEGKPANPDFPTQFEVRSLGKGRLAVARQALTDAYQVAVDTQLLTSHASDLVKVYNSSSSGCSTVHKLAGWQEGTGADPELCERRTSLGFADRVGEPGVPALPALVDRRRQRHAAGRVAIRGILRG